MSFKKHGEDPISTRPSLSRGGLQFVGHMFAALFGFGMGVDNGQPEDRLRYRKSRRNRSRVKPLKRNMRLVSKRVRRKHRRAA